MILTKLQIIQLMLAIKSIAEYKDQEGNPLKKSNKLTYILQKNKTSIEKIFNDLVEIDPEKIKVDYLRELEIIKSTCVDKDENGEYLMDDLPEGYLEDIEELDNKYNPIYIDALNLWEETIESESEVNLETLKLEDLYFFNYIKTEEKSEIIKEELALTEKDMNGISVLIED